MLKSVRTVLIVTAATVSSSALANTAFADTAFADTQWEQNHPRREEVNNRLATQNWRIHQQVKDGDLSRGQAARLHREDHQIRREERLMASQNGGHITRNARVC